MLQGFYLKINDAFGLGCIGNFHYISRTALNGRSKLYENFADRKQRYVVRQCLAISFPLNLRIGSDAILGSLTPQKSLLVAPKSTSIF